MQQHKVLCRINGRYIDINNLSTQRHGDSIATLILNLIMISLSFNANITSITNTLANKKRTTLDSELVEVLQIANWFTLEFCK
jgi:hypothetical protein